MKISYDWLQSYFDEKLPSAEELAETLTFHAFEIESVEQVGDDQVIDVDVLPNRASDCLSHRGIARELSTLLSLPLRDDPLKKSTNSTPDSNLLEVDVKNSELVNRFSAAVISGVEVGESPEWLRKRLEAIGQKSINNVVDATNYVMFDIGQPLHAFDRDKMTERDGGYVICVRTGKAGEKITVLTGEEYATEGALLIADGNGDAPLGIAGVKGGTQAEVGKGTKNLILEAANFNYVSVRKTAQALKLWTDASTRFQNEPSPELTLHALREVVRLIGGTLEGYVDHYPKPTERKPVSVSVSGVNALLGTDISPDEVESILNRFGFSYDRDGESFSVMPPFERTDLNIPEDLVEEVGRVYGYEHVSTVALPESKKKPEVNKRFYYAEKIRKVLIGQGFSEVYTYTLRPRGKVELANALAADKPFLRDNMADGLRESLELNVRNADLLGLERICIFEIGTVFTKDVEHTSLALGVKNAKKMKEKEEDVLKKGITALEKELGAELPGAGSSDVYEVNLTELLENLPEPAGYEDMSAYWKKDVSYTPFSQYPFALRDVALWVPAGTKDNDVLAVIKEAAGDLLVNHRLFDVYEKDQRISYAFRLVFQSHEKTLSDDEISKVMERVTAALEERGFEVR